MLLALLLAIAAALAFGVAAVLQALATEGTQDAGGLDPLLLLRLLRRPAFLGSLALNGLGLGLHVSALQSLPLFLVQAVIASSVAVTALLSVRVFGVPLVRVQWIAVATVLVGLALLGPSASSGEAVPADRALELGLLAVLAVLAVLSVVAGRVPGVGGAVLLGLLAGGGFGIVAICARLLPDLSPLVLLRSPVLYVLLLAGALAFLLYSTAMQRGSATTTTAAMVITQTAVPAIAGILLLGDEVRAGYGLLAVGGFVLALAGAVALGRAEAERPVVSSTR